MRGKAVRIARETCVAPVDFQSLRAIVLGGDEHAQADPVGDLRAQLAFLGIHRADQREARRVVDRVLTAFDVHDAKRCGVEQRVDDDVGEEIDLVHIEDVAVRSREQPRPESDAAALERGAQVDRAHDVVELRIGRQLDDLAPRFAGRHFFRAVAAVGACRAQVRAVRVAAVGARRALEDRQ